MEQTKNIEFTAIFNSSRAVKLFTEIISPKFTFLVSNTNNEVSVSARKCCEIPLNLREVDATELCQLANRTNALLKVSY